MVASLKNITGYKLDHVSMDSTMPLNVMIFIGITSFEFATANRFQRTTKKKRFGMHVNEKAIVDHLVLDCFLKQVLYIRMCTGQQCQSQPMVYAK